MAVATPPSDPPVRQLMAREETLESSPELLRLRDTLLREGLTHVKKTYRGQAGHAAIVEAHLDDATRARLKTVNLTGLW